MDLFDAGDAAVSSPDEESDQEVDELAMDDELHDGPESQSAPES